jgi:AAA domain
VNAATDWPDSDIEAVRKLAAGTSADDARRLLDTYAGRGLRKPVGYAIKNPAEVARDLGELRAKRQKTETQRIVAELRSGPVCEHDDPGGASSHPENGWPLCPLCRSKAQAEGLSNGRAPVEIGVPTRSLQPSQQDLRDSGDSEVSPDDRHADQLEQVQGDTGDTDTPMRSAWTATELLAADFEAPRWAVEGLIPEGVMFLAGPPKVGKSWLALALCIAVASGGKALGSIGTVQGPALYLALEDTPRRLQSRLRKVLGEQMPPENLTLAVECPPLPSGGVEYIAAWLSEHPKARLIVIDVFERIRGPIPSGTSVYAGDYMAVRSVKALADRFGVAIVLIHHMRKMSSADFLNEVSGTLGLSGAADTIAVLKRTRGEHDGTLNITGRDVEENEYAMKFATDTGTWQLLGRAADYGLHDTRRQIVTHVRSHEGARPKEIADALGLVHDLVKKTIKRMADDGQLETDGHGRYYTPEGVPDVPDA